jgi:hypothetical protein
MYELQPVEVLLQAVKHKQINLSVSKHSFNIIATAVSTASASFSSRNIKVRNVTVTTI